MKSKRIEQKDYVIVKSIYGCIEDHTTYVADSTVKALVAIAFFHIGMAKDLNFVIKSTSSKLEGYLRVFQPTIKSFEDIDCVIELYNQNETYQRFVELYLEDIEAFNNNDS